MRIGLQTPESGWPRHSLDLISISTFSHRKVSMSSWETLSRSSFSFFVLPEPTSYFMESLLSCYAVDHWHTKLISNPIEGCAISIGFGFGLWRSWWCHFWSTSHGLLLATSGQIEMPLHLLTVQKMETWHGGSWKGSKSQHSSSHFATISSFSTSLRRTRLIQHTMRSQSRRRKSNSFTRSTTSGRIRSTTLSPATDQGSSTCTTGSSITYLSWFWLLSMPLV